MSEASISELDKRYQKLEEKKDWLEQLKRQIPWEEFRPLLEQIRHKPRKSNAGRKPIDAVLMFKQLILQKLFNLSDEELEYQVNDRLSFMRFLELSLAEPMPDATTVWLFRDQLTHQGLIEQLFERFEQYLRQAGYQAKGGQIVDATLVPVPKQRNSKEENEQVKAGEIPAEWQQTPHRLCQKDTDARWTKKNGVSHFGYKDHISIDVEHGFIRRYEVTDAAIHDSQVLGAVLDVDNEDDSVWADSAYRSELIEVVLALMGFVSHIHERGYRNHPLSGEQKTANRERSRTRAKVEHVFGAWVTEMGGKLLRSIGKKRARAHLGLKNWAYNLKRYLFLEAKCA